MEKKLLFAADCCFWRGAYCGYQVTEYQNISGCLYNTGAGS